MVEIFWGQLIKLVQVASTSELHENQWNDQLFSSKPLPLISAGSQKSILTASKIKYEKFGPRIQIPHFKKEIL